MKFLRRGIFFFATAALLIWWLLPTAGPQVQRGSVLALQLSGSYVEAAAPSFLARVFGEERQPFISVLSELAKAERDDRISGVALRIRRLDIGWAMAQELRDAIAGLRAAGKGTVALLETGALGANLEYYVASAADEVLLSSGTSGPLVGLGMEFFFFGGLWEKLGVDPEVVVVGEYKSAVEVLAGTGMSPAYREMAESLLDSIWGEFVTGIAEGRGLEPRAVREAIDSSPVTAEELETFGLVDGTDSFEGAVSRLGKVRIDGSDYQAVDPAEVGFAPVAQFALVYGSGTVVMGEGLQSPTGGQRFSSDSVSRALIDAADDPSIDAIVFRVDSPGGSPLASEIIWHAAESFFFLNYQYRFNPLFCQAPRHGQSYHTGTDNHYLIICCHICYSIASRVSSLNVVITIMVCVRITPTHDCIFRNIPSSSDVSWSRTFRI